MTAIHQDPVTPTARTPFRQWISRAVSVLCWSYAGSVLALWALVRWSGLDWWPVTLFLYSPRWVVGLPALILAPAALAVHRRGLIALGLGLLVLIGPVMGYLLQLPHVSTPPATGAILRVLTFNAQGGEHIAVEPFEAILTEARPDLVLIQEWAAPTEVLFPRAAGWHVRAGQGMCLASRFPILTGEYLDEKALGASGVLARYTVEAPVGPLRVYNLHLPTPRDGLEAVIGQKWRGIPGLRAAIQLQRHGSEVSRAWVDETEPPAVIAGDFNMPDDSPLYRRSWSAFPDAFHSAGSGFGYTKWTRWHGVRIDHVLTGPAWHTRSCRVWPDVGSDHRPVTAELEWIGANP